MPTLSPRVLLASASPRRRELLQQLGVPHEICGADLDERRRAGESAEQCVQRLAAAKADAVWARRGGADVVVLGADTEVEIEGELLGKPRDRAHGLAMLARLSARRHRVISAVALVGAQGRAARLSLSTVQFAPLSVAEAEAYWDTGEPLGKAGGYAIQGYGAAFISALQGSYSGVMGLPLYETAELLRQAGVPLWQSKRS